MYKARVIGRQMWLIRMTITSWWQSISQSPLAGFCVWGDQGRAEKEKLRVEAGIKIDARALVAFPLRGRQGAVTLASTPPPQFHALIDREVAVSPVMQSNHRAGWLRKYCLEARGTFTWADIYKLNEDASN